MRPSKSAVITFEFLDVTTPTNSAGFWVSSLAAGTALFVLGVPDDGSGRLLGLVRDVMAEHRLAGHSRIEALRIDMAALEARGCHWHASVQDHRAIAGQLIALIERWFAPAPAPAQALAGQDGG